MRSALVPQGFRWIPRSSARERPSVGGLGEGTSVRRARARAFGAMTLRSRVLRRAFAPLASRGSSSSASPLAFAAPTAAARCRAWARVATPHPRTASLASLPPVGFASFRAAAAAHAASARVRSTARASAATAADVGTLVVVESPAKAGKVQKYLGDGYTVLASYGHVRDLVEKSGSVRPDDDFAMSWAESARAGVVDDIVAAASRADALILATDPDREGEAISWHVVELLRERGVVGPGTDHLPVSRVTFTEVTKNAVLEAFAAPREVSAPLVDAYLARRALDYLFGFTLSGVLWRKMPSRERLSAGRVQSAALRLVCEREFDIERFVREEYWSVRAGLCAASGANAAASFEGALTHVGGTKLGKMEPGSRAEAEAAAAEILAAANGAGLFVQDVTEREVSRRARPPFTTSTMQQEASSRLGFGASRTMSAAQSLYEGRNWGEGLITYMRTDGLHVSPVAVKELRAVAEAEFGAAYVPETPNYYKKKQKNAQEAHEAIRPTSAAVLPSAVANRLGRGSDEARLYRLIWARTMASQMSPAVTKRVVAEVWSRARDDGGEEGATRLRAGGSRLLFPGHLAAYDHGAADDAAGGGGGWSRIPANEGWLPRLDVGEEVRLRDDSVRVVEKDADAPRGFASAARDDGLIEDDADDGDGDGETTMVSDANASSSSSSGGGGGGGGIVATQHWTQPPGRYTEGTLVKALEEKGIGRPSTYASIMRVITKRGYVSSSGGRGPLVPETRGRLVSSFLSHFFDEYVDYGFTAGLEDSLDDIASGKEGWKGVLENFWRPFAGEVETLKGIRTSLVVDVLDTTLGAHFFGDDEETFETRMRRIEEAAERAAEEDDANSPYPEIGFDRDALSDARRCPSCDDGRLGLKLSRTGGFIGCSNYPSCAHTQPLTANAAGAAAEEGMTFPARLGTDPETGRVVSIQNGPYGAYVQLDVPTPTPEAVAAAKASREAADAALLARLEAEAAKEAEEAYAAASLAALESGKKPPRRKKPKKVKLPKARKETAPTPRRFGLRNLDIQPERVTLNLALDLLRYPAVLGKHPEDGEDVTMNAGPFGWYVSHAGTNASLPKKALREHREETVRRLREEAEATSHVDDEDKRAWREAGEESVTLDGDFVDDSETETAEASLDANVEVDAVAEAKEATSEAELRALYGPATLEFALEALARKRAKPAGERRGWGRGKKATDDASTEKDTKDTSSTSSGKGKGRGSKRAAKPEKAKRAPSAYLLYCAETRGSLPQGLTAPEQAKLLGDGWKSLDAADRARFESQAAEAKASLAASKETTTSDGNKTKAKTKTEAKEKEKAKAKRPPSAYILFCSDARATLPEDMKATEKMKILGARWKSLGEEERARWNAAAAAAKREVSDASATATRA